MSNSEREKIIRYYRASGEAELAAKLIDLADGAVRGQKYRVSEFLDPYGYSVAETIKAHYSQLNIEANGGYRGAERVKAAFVDEDFPGSIDFGLVAIAVRWDERYYQISHRDVLGSLMGLGVKRELFGDIIMKDGMCQIVADTAIAPFVLQNLHTVGSATVQTEIVDLTAIEPKEEKVKDIRTTVASLRLDTVAAAGFGLSRTKMAAEIEADKLKVNWQPAKGAAQTISAGDMISMRGRGRLEVCEIIGQTRKGRMSILLKRYY